MKGAFSVVSLVQVLLLILSDWWEISVILKTAIKKGKKKNTTSSPSLQKEKKKKKRKPSLGRRGPEAARDHRILYGSRGSNRPTAHFTNALSRSSPAVLTARLRLIHADRRPKEMHHDWQHWPPLRTYIRQIKMCGLTWDPIRRRAPCKTVKNNTVETSLLPLCLIYTSPKSHFHPLGSLRPKSLCGRVNTTAESYRDKRNLFPTCHLRACFSPQCFCQHFISSCIWWSCIIAAVITCQTLPG